MKRPNKQMEPEEVRDFIKLAAKDARPFVTDGERGRTRGLVRGVFGQVLGDDHLVHVSLGWLCWGGADDEQWEPMSSNQLTAGDLRAILDWMDGVLIGTEWVRSDHFGKELTAVAKLAAELHRQWIAYLEQDR